MANPEHLDILKQGVEAWNAWREEKPDTRPDLVRADLFAANLAGFNLSGADFRGAELWHADLRNADLAGARLGGAKLGATVGYEHALRRNLQKPFLRLRGCSLRDAWFGMTELGYVDLSETTGLGSVHHVHRSRIDIGSLELTAERIPRQEESILLDLERFYRGAGLPEHLIAYYRKRVGERGEQYSSFISYSHTDKPFARRLHDQLQARGIRCWLDEKDLKPGDRILDVVDGAIRLHDKLLICCSRASLDNSWWVKDEIRKAQERERKEDRAIIIPLNLDGYLFDWQDGLASDLTSRLAADFTGWEQDNAKFEEQFERVVEALRA